MLSTTELKIIKSDMPEMAHVQNLLAEQRIRQDENGGTVYGFYVSDQFAGTATISGNTLRSVAISKAYQGSNTLALMIQDIVEDMLHENVFVYTSERSSVAFERIGFYRVAQAVTDDEHVVLLEKRPDGLRRYLRQLRHYRLHDRDIGAIVMNGNPFTRGHLYLVEYAAKQCDHLFIFVVSEEASTFPFEVRKRLIEAGTAHLENVTVLSGGDYIISQATFPSYFLKAKESAVDLQAKLDLSIFGGQIAKAMGIKKRFFGEEPYCETTRKYNFYMKHILPDYGVEAIEIPRVQSDGEAISASRVRALVKQEDWRSIEKLVPSGTYAFLTSGEADQIIEKLKRQESRH